MAKFTHPLGLSFTAYRALCSAVHGLALTGINDFMVGSEPRHEKAAKELVEKGYARRVGGKMALAQWPVIKVTAATIDKYNTDLKAHVHG